MLLLEEGGATVIDTSPMYGRSETVLGDLIAELGARPKLWLATKVWTRGRSEGERQIAESMRRLRTDRLELLQIHNLVDWRVHVPTLKKLRDAGRIRYTGITHYRADAQDDVLQVLEAERFDWVQINYSLAERNETRLLPYAPARARRLTVRSRTARVRADEGRPLPLGGRDRLLVWAQYAQVPAHTPP